MTPATTEERTPDAADSLIREFCVVPGEARHGVTTLRAVSHVEFRDAQQGESNGLGLLNGHFSVFNVWTRIDSLFEGLFLERIAPGAFTKTFQENRPGMRCLFQHGRDPVVGMKPLGPIRELEEDEIGARYEVPLDDTSYNRDLLPGLRQDPSLYGASFRFQVMREEVDRDPGESEHNPHGIEERTVTECRVREFGPVTFGAYEDATAGVRGITDEYLLEFQRDVGADLLVARAVEFHKLRSLTPTPPAEPPETTEPPEGSAESAEITGEAESRDVEGEAPPPAPDGRPLVTSDSLRTTRLPGTTQPLRTTETQEPAWKLL
jgi:HK97 family phage prohead protease